MEGDSASLRELSDEVAAIATSGEAQQTHVSLIAAVIELQSAPGEIKSAGDCVEQADMAQERAKAAGQAALKASAAAAKAAEDAKQHEEAAEEAAQSAAKEAEAAQNERVKAADEEARAAIAAIPPPNPALVAAHTAQAAVHEGNAAAHDANKHEFESTSHKQQREASTDRREESSQKKFAAGQKQQEKDEATAEERYRELAAGAIARCSETISTAVGLLDVARAHSEQSAAIISRKLGEPDETNIAEGKTALELSKDLPKKIGAALERLGGFPNKLPHPRSELEDFTKAAIGIERTKQTIDELRVKASEVCTNLEQTARILAPEAGNLGGRPPGLHTPTNINTNYL